MNELKIVNSKQGSCDRKWRKKTSNFEKESWTMLTQSEN